MSDSDEEREVEKKAVRKDDGKRGETGRTQHIDPNPGAAGAKKQT